MYDVIVIGGLNTDFFAHAEKLPAAGQALQAATFLETAGGKAANQAVAAARLGARVALIGRVGDDDRGRQLLRHLEAEHVDVTRVRRTSGRVTGAAVIHVAFDGTKQILAALGANLQLTPVEVETACEQIGSARIVLVQLEIPLASAVAALKWGRVVGAQTVLDPAPAVPLSQDILKIVDVIKPNASEAEVITGVKSHDRASAGRAASALLQGGAGAVAVQAGDEGNLLVWPGGEHWLPGIPIRSVDATGAGDAFAGTLAFYLARGRSFIEAGKYANTAAALATRELGAQSSLARGEEELEQWK
jgi:ribokinase